MPGYVAVVILVSLGSVITFRMTGAACPGAPRKRRSPSSHGRCWIRSLFAELHPVQTSWTAVRVARAVMMSRARAREPVGEPRRLTRLTPPTGERQSTREEDISRLTSLLPVTKLLYS